MYSLLKSIFFLRGKRHYTRHLSRSRSLRIVQIVAVLFALIFINSAAMISFEDMLLQDALWLSFTTLATVGYGDFSPATTVGRVTTIITMYTFAITLLSILAAEVIDWRISITEKKRRGLWEFKGMTDHIQIINTPNVDTDIYLSRLVKEIKNTPKLADTQIQLLSRKYPNGLPHALSELQILLRSGSAEDGEVIYKVNLQRAKYIIILARDFQDSTSDSITFDILHRVIALNPKACIVVEAVLDENRQRFLDIGATVVIRPIRAYPEVVVRALANPGTERVLEDLFQAHGDSICKVACAFNNFRWLDILQICIDARLGTPLAYFKQGHLEVQPAFDKLCSGDALAILVKNGTFVDPEKIKQLFAKHS